MNKVIYNDMNKKYNYNSMDYNKDELVELLKDKEVTCHYQDGSLLHDTSSNIGFALTLITGYRGSYIIY